MTVPSSPIGEILAFDVGTVRIGVARASTVVLLSEPLTTIPNDDELWHTISKLCNEQRAVRLVVGLPRGLDGQETAQTASTRQFADELSQKTGLPVSLQDEAVTSRNAEEELSRRGKPYAKSDIDALAATYILDDFITERHGKI